MPYLTGPSCSCAFGKGRLLDGLVRGDFLKARHETVFPRVFSANGLHQRGPFGFQPRFSIEVAGFLEVREGILVVTGYPLYSSR